MKLRLLVLMVLVTGCGQAASSPSKAVAETVYVTGVAHSGVPAVFGLDGATGRVTVEVPLAAHAPDWKRLYAVKGSQLHFLDPAGNQVVAVDLPGGYELPRTTFDGRPEGLSQNGRWLVLFRAAASKSSFLLVDTRAKLIAHRVDFDGWYEFDGVDNSGTRLYLIHHFADNPGKYEVAKYSFATGEMQAPIIEKTGRLRVMQGNRVSALTDPAGNWQYSLYRGGAEGAFIHALMLDGDYGAAWCVDLPGGTSPDVQLAWSLTMSPDGKRLYAVNAILREALWYSIDSVSVGQPPALFRQAGFSQAAGFQPPFVTDAEAKEIYGLGASALTPDLKRLVVAMSSGLVVLDPGRMTVVDRWATTHVFRSLAVSADGTSIYGLDPSGLVRIDLRTGTVGKALPSPANPNAILGVRAM